MNFSQHKSLFGNTPPANLSQLRKQWASCKKCYFANRWSETGPCLPRITPGSVPTIVVVGQSPGEVDMINKKPFTGPQGKITRDFFTEAGFDEEKILYTNVLLCSCAMSPTKTFLSNCALQLDQTLDIINPVLVIALGDVASRRLTNKPLTDTRGKLVKYRSFPVFSIIHTAAIARQRSEIEAAKMSGLVVGDLQNAKALHDQFLAMRKGR